MKIKDVEKGGVSVREYFDLDKQIQHLVIDKSLLISHKDLKVIEEVLIDQSYQYFVNCSKIKQAEYFEPNLKMYKTAPFHEWCDYFAMDKKVCKHLIGNLVDFEQTINSRISHYLSGLMARNELMDYEQNEIILIISQMRDRKDVQFSRYKGEETWNYVSKMTFGEMKQLVFWLYENQLDIYLKVIHGYSFMRKNVKKRFDELNRLRNSLFHLVPLSIYLTKGSVRNRKLNNNERKKVVRWLSKRSASMEMKQAIDNICFYADNYVKIKNSLRNVD